MKNQLFSPSRENLASIREGEYEGLEQKLKDKNWKPDFGPTKFNNLLVQQ